MVNAQSSPHWLTSSQGFNSLCSGYMPMASNGLWVYYGHIESVTLGMRIRNSSLIGEDFERKIGPYLPSPTDLNCPPIVGRLCSLVEGGGKRRIIAIGNYINQRLLRPVHDWLMQVLSHIPQDGTFDQTKPLDNLVGSSVCYSFDLKSASQITTRAFFVVI